MRLTQEMPTKALRTLYRTQAKPTQEKIDCSKLSKEIDTTYAHMVKIVGKLEDDGYIKREVEGRSKYIYLTDLGEQVAEKVTELRELTENGGVPA